MHRVNGQRANLAATSSRWLGIWPASAVLIVCFAAPCTMADDVPAPSAPSPVQPANQESPPKASDTAPASPAITLADSLPDQVAAGTLLSISASYVSLPPPPPMSIAGWESAGGGVRVNDGLAIIGSRSQLTLSSGPSGRQTTEVYDVAATIDAFDLAEVSFSLVGGVRVATEGPVDADATRTAITPVLGPAVRWRRGPSELRALILGDATGANEDFVEFRIEQLWHLTADATLSLGYQHQRSLFQEVPVRTAERRDAFSIELRLNF